MILAGDVWPHFNHVTLLYLALDFEPLARGTASSSSAFQAEMSLLVSSKGGSADERSSFHLFESLIAPAKYSYKGQNNLILAQC
jgi:hypothetical protein